MDPIISKVPGGRGFSAANSVNAKEPSMQQVTDNAQTSPQEMPGPIQGSAKNQDQQIAELQKMIDAIQGPKKVLEVSVHQDTHAIMIKVLNEQTGDVIREIPPERRLDIAAKMMELAGIIIDRKV